MIDHAFEQRDLWVFGYGSLMWNPGFAYEQAVAAELSGYHRAFCVYSVYYRGTPARPGLVLGLDRGGVCQGMAFRVAAQNAVETIRYLRAREQVTGVYRETVLPIMLQGAAPSRVPALSFVVERCHPGYTHGLKLAHQAHLIRAAMGRAGPNLDYALNTICHLQKMGCAEPNLVRLLARLGPLFWQRNLLTGQEGVRVGSGQTLADQLRLAPRKAPRLRPDQRKRFVFRDCLAGRLEARWHKAR